MQAANYLNIKGLLDLTCLTVANMIEGARLPCQACPPLSCYLCGVKACAAATSAYLCSFAGKSILPDVSAASATSGSQQHAEPAMVCRQDARGDPQALQY